VVEFCEQNKPTSRYTKAPMTSLFKLEILCTADPV